MLRKVLEMRLPSILTRLLLLFVTCIVRASLAFNSSQTNSSYVIEDVTGIEIIAKLMLMRDNIILAPDATSVIDEEMIDKIMDFIYVNQRRRHAPGGLYLYPTLERRDIGCDAASQQQDKRIGAVCDAITAHCLSPADMIKLLPRPVTFAQGIAYLCPLMMFRQMRPICSVHDIDADKPSEQLKLLEPPIEKVWGFGVLFVTLSIVVSMGGLIILPFLRREARRTILTLFEGLAVGGLVGSAIIHLFPKAYNITQEVFQQYFSRIFVVFGGIYLFYVVERVLKIITSVRNGKSKKKKTERRRASSFREEHFSVLNLPPLIPRRNSVSTLSPMSPVSINMQEMKDLGVLQKPNERSSSIKSAQPNSAKDQLDKCLASVKKSSSQPLLHQIAINQSKSSLNQNLGDKKSGSMTSKQSYVHDIAGRRQDHDTATSRLSTDSVAWMIVLGDASLNFIDGLSIGAAFDRNILAGISISVAVMLEEVPHRLGTFAVLIRAGMKMKQSLLWIFISACFLYPGLVIGTILGDAAEDASPYIFALAGGMFLYMALVDVMKEMNNSMENALRKGVRSGLQILALQNLGIIIAIIILSVLALYEQEMDFEQVEIKELTDNALL